MFLTCSKKTKADKKKSETVNFFLSAVKKKY